MGRYGVAALPDATATGAGSLIYVIDEIGGPVMVFSDGANWRRMTDRAVVGEREKALYCHKVNLAASASR